MASASHVASSPLLCLFPVLTGSKDIAELVQKQAGALVESPKNKQKSMDGAVAVSPTSIARL